MKTIHEILSEVNDITYIKKNSNLGFDNIGNVQHPNHIESSGYKKISSFKGNEVWHRHKERDGTSEFKVRDKKTGKIHIELDGKHPDSEQKVLHIGSLASSGSGPKAHEFYHHLLKKGHIHTLTTDAQSEGGKKVWMKLNKKKSVHIHGWDPAEDKPVNLGKRFDPDETHYSKKSYRDKHSDITNKLYQKRDPNDKEDMFDKASKELEPERTASNIHLVAHLKKLKEEAPVNSVGSGAIAGLNGDPPVRRGKFGKHDTFLVSPNTFLKARNAKRKGAHWRKYLEEDENYDHIREYAFKRPKDPIILQCERTGAMCYAKYGKE